MDDRAGNLALQELDHHAYRLPATAWHIYDDYLSGSWPALLQDGLNNPHGMWALRIKYPDAIRNEIAPAVGGIWPIFAYVRVFGQMFWYATPGGTHRVHSACVSDRPAEAHR